MGNREARRFSEDDRIGKWGHDPASIWHGANARQSHENEPPWILSSDGP